MMILPLDDPRATLASVGGKALNLGVMLRAGLPVPNGFVLTTEAYRAFVEANALGTDRAAFEVAPVPTRLVDEIVAVYGGGAVAVRSSATAEDLPDASFAGQQDTYLNVRGEGAVIAAVRRCWGSLFTERAVAYRARQGIQPNEVALAVVVQEMAPATAAGVLFTVHPVTGRADRMVINATWGLGEALVSGRVNPDSITVEKATGRVLAEERGDKATMTAATAEGTAEVDVDAARRGQRALRDEEIVELARLGRELERIFGAPQDVEWAIVDGKPVLLQSRAITTVRTVPGDDAWPPLTRGEPQPFDVWTQQDMGERWPEPVTPLTWSVSEPMNQFILDGMMTGLKAPYAGKIQWSRRAFGRVYMNEGALLYAYTHGFGMPMAMMTSGLTHPAARPADAEGWRLGRVLQHLPMFYAAAVGWEKNVAAFEREFPQIDAWVAEFMARPLTEDDATLLREAQEVWFARILHYVRFHTNATSLSMSSYDELVKACGDAELAQVLVGGISGVIAAEMVPMLVNLAGRVRAAGLAAVVLEGAPGAGLVAVRAVPELREALDRFLARHGHRCLTEAELRFPRWAEAPELVIEQLRPYLRADLAVGDQAAARREAATAKLLAESGWWKRKVVERAIERAHRFTRMRDNGQSYVVKLLMPLRRLLAELGRRLVERGRLREVDDVFFLVQEELLADGDLQSKADARRKAHEHWLGEASPYALDRDGEPIADVVEGDDHTLVGIAASRGTVTGIARVVLSPQDAHRLEPGDILVTRATDPGWTPVFSTIGGAVLEIGGLLSHGAIVAREYELPAVVNVPQATRRIVDGQRITVDGTTGRVTLLG